MDTWFLIYLRMIAYVVVFLISTILVRIHCLSYVLIGNIFLSVSFMFSLIVARILVTEHSAQLAGTVLSLGVVIWALMHFIELVTGDCFFRRKRKDNHDKL